MPRDGFSMLYPSGDADEDPLTPALRGEGEGTPLRLFLWHSLVHSDEFELSILETAVDSICFDEIMLIDPPKSPSPWPSPRKTGARGEEAIPLFRLLRQLLFRQLTQLLLRRQLLLNVS
jgi:hypothetical protein